MTEIWICLDANNKGWILHKFAILNILGEPLTSQENRYEVPNWLVQQLAKRKPEVGKLYKITQPESTKLRLKLSEQILELLWSGMSAKQIAYELDIDQTVIYKAAKQHNTGVKDIKDALLIEKLKNILKVKPDISKKFLALELGISNYTLYQLERRLKK